MKKLLILVMVLAMASLASATLQISVNGTVDPPDTSIVLMPSDHVVLDVFGAGNTNDAIGIYMLIIGPGSIQGGTIVYGTGELKSYKDAEAKAIEAELSLEEYLASWGIEGLTDLSAMVIATAPPAPVLDGTLVDGIDFHCEGPGEVLIRLVAWDTEGTMFDLDTQIIHQIPEPVTIALLGLGGLLLRRRMA